MFLDGLYGIAGACRGESTRWREEWRDTSPIEVDGKEEEKGKERGEHL